MINKHDFNKQQLEAIFKSVKYDFTLIWGPPGTGKTLVGCIIAYQYVQVNKKQDNIQSVLYCGPSNQSVNVVAEKLINMFGERCPKLVRIFNSEVVNFDFPYAGGRIKIGLNGCPENLKSIALHHIVRKQEKPYSNLLNEMDEFFQKNMKRNQIERNEFARRLNNYKIILKKAYEEEIIKGNYEIILSTAAGACKKLLEKSEIACVILDESGMCTEPESIGLLTNRKKLKKVVLIGDHKQLRAIVTSHFAKSKQFDVSLFERLYKFQNIYCTMLDTQYRMHPSICEFPSIHFYKNNKNDNYTKTDILLKTACCESWTGIPDKNVNIEFNGLQYVGIYPSFQNDLKRNNINIADEFWAKGGRRISNFQCFSKSIDFNGPVVYEKILFINTVGVEINQEISCSTGNNQSKSNEAEANVVEFLYKKLINKIHVKQNASQSILVITQYRLQENVLKNICTAILKESNIPGSPRVSTVVKSQGSESDYVIFSTVRSLPKFEDIDKNPTSGWVTKYLGSVTDPNLFNVALTRAQKGIFIVGNSHLLSTHGMWKTFIDNLKNRNCFIDDILQLY